ncbi:MAG: hypothetical protein O4804_04220 [Trichodesmium sp. St11_bin5]|nr:hypothetical protein [Trichodesmium sp. St11_bin5]
MLLKFSTNVKITRNEKIYGVITTGTVWQFLELEGEAVVLDLQEYSVENLPKI